MARHKGLNFYRRRKKISSALLHEIFSWIFGIVIAAFLAVVGVYFFGMKISVIGVSMEETLYNGQSILVDRFLYTLSSPKRGSVIVFLPNGNENSHYYVKRVLGVPGDHILIQDGLLYVNSEISPFVDDKILDPGIVANEYTLKNGEYFCMGDNPNNSEDSRSANLGPVEDEDIVGKAWLKFKTKDSGFGRVK